MKQKIQHWADNLADSVVKVHGDKEGYVCATGISPSGTVHFGNFRETMTTELVVRALRSKGKNARFIYSWDDFDRFRKVPKNINEDMSRYIELPYSKVPDPFGCHKSWAEHFEKEYEESLPVLGVEPEFIYQNEQYSSCAYAEKIKTALHKKEAIKAILDKYRKEPHKDFWPLVVYCEKCSKNLTKITDYDGEYQISYECKCGHNDVIDFRKKGIVKLKWRIDWPMRWSYEEVDFEPGGKEHSTPGGSYTTAKEIVVDVFGRKPPIYQKYDFIILKGGGGKMSGSLGNVIALKDVLEVYEPSVVRYMFASTRPNAEFFVSFDLDVFKIYEDFDKCERIYFEMEDAKDDKDFDKQSRIYELSAVKIPEKSPLQPSFRHLTSLIQIYDGNLDEIKKHFDVLNNDDLERLKIRLECAKNWLEKHAPDEMKFRVQTEVKVKLDAKEKKALGLLKETLETKDYKEKALHNEFYAISEQVGFKPQDFFKAVYKVLINKEKGPRLASFILTLGKKRVVDLLGKV